MARVKHTPESAKDSPPAPAPAEETEKKRMEWDHEMDRKLLAGMGHVNGAPNYLALAKFVDPNCSIRAVQHRLIDVKKDYPWPVGMDKEGNVAGESAVLPGSFDATRKRKSGGNTKKAASGKNKKVKKETEHIPVATPEPKAEVDAKEEASS
ncbi:hypothetical protein N7474_005992 [Penicillium riverlandense]|uniref:uncharacterized protein n=1 Tax=Penicillium riverlandense TaxID=1903569 RepID=UPI002546A33F|nr:uncharacterized protein N7474_005992 [Penicillium riverlandense]KAJ5820401.1 hypothetical protein N7474_005992 [Penicillium riverlandense]